MSKTSTPNFGNLRNILFGFGWLVTTLIALFGGCPGYEDWTAKPKYKFVHEFDMKSTWYQTENPTKSGALFLVTGAVYNEGKAPFFPHKWFLQFEIDKFPGILAGTIGPDFNKSIQDSKKIDMSQLHTKDFNLVTRINSMDATYGALLFYMTLPQSYFNQFPDLKFRIVCLDLAGNKFESESFEYHGESSGSMSLLKFGVKIIDTTHIRK